MCTWATANTSNYTSRVSLTLWGRDTVENHQIRRDFISHLNLGLRFQTTWQNEHFRVRRDELFKMQAESLKKCSRLFVSWDEYALINNTFHRQGCFYYSLLLLTLNNDKLQWNLKTEMFFTFAKAKLQTSWAFSSSVCDWVWVWACAAPFNEFSKSNTQQ